MSKFFDEISRTRNAAHPMETPARGAGQEMLAAIGASTGAKSDLGSSRLEHCRKMGLPRQVGLPILTQANEFGEHAIESYRALRTRVVRIISAAGLRSVAVTSAIRGEGKTFTALNLALCCAQLPNFRVLVVDGDLRARGLTRALNIHAAPGLGEILTGQVAAENAILAIESPNLYVLGAGSVSSPPPELYMSQHWKEFIYWCNESFKLVIIDTPPILPLADFEQISAACDGVLMVVRAFHAQRELLQKAASQIDQKKFLGIIHNAVENGELTWSHARHTKGG